VTGIFFSLGVLAIQALAFVGGLVAVAAVYAIGSAVRARDPILVLVLTGVVVGALLGAGVGLVKYLADPYNQLPAMTFWLLGSLAAANVSDLLPLFGPVALGTAVLVALRWRMNVMSLPEEEARSLGVSPQFIVLDEPTASLDFGNQGKVMREIRALAQSGHGVLFTTHDPNHALRAADRAYLLREGNRVADGPVATVLNRQQLEALYHATVERLTDPDSGAVAFLPG
jgi:hypothetical protein